MQFSRCSMLGVWCAGYRYVGNFPRRLVSRPAVAHLWQQGRRVQAGARGCQNDYLDGAVSVGCQGNCVGVNL
jgi:hypothetical protein